MKKNLAHKPVATICEWRDNQTTTVTKILVTIHDCSCDHTYCYHTLLIIIPKLSNPLEIVDVVDAIFRHLFDNVTCYMWSIKNLESENEYIVSCNSFFYNFFCNNIYLIGAVISLYLYTSIITDK